MSTTTAEAEARLLWLLEGTRLADEARGAVNYHDWGVGSVAAVRIRDGFWLCAGGTDMSVAPDDGGYIGFFTYGEHPDHPGDLEFADDYDEVHADTWDEAREKVRGLLDG